MGVVTVTSAWIVTETAKELPRGEISCLQANVRRTLVQLNGIYRDEYLSPLLVIELKQKWEDNPMSKSQQNESAPSNQFSEGPVCDYCAGVTGHKPWCVTCNAIVRYAFGAVSSGNLLTLGDQLILHALGVEWSGRGL